MPVYASRLRTNRALPESLKQIFTPNEYAWLSDERKATLVQRETEPDWRE